MKTINRFGYLFYSRRVWLLLVFPPENPIFRRTIKTDFKHPAKLFHIVLMALVASILSYVVVDYLTRFNLPLPVSYLAVLAIISSAITIIWIANIVSAIADECHQATYDLICMTPLGAFGVNWSIATGILHRHDLFSWVSFGRKLFSGLILFILLTLFLVLLSLTLNNGFNEFLDGFVLFFEIVAFTFLSYVEYIQSVTFGVLFAILFPNYVGYKIDGHIWAVFVFIALQIIVFALFLIGCLLIQAYFVSKHWQIKPLLAQLLLLYLMRECCIYLVWKLLLYQLNAKFLELAEA